MMKKWLSLILIAGMLLALTPAALASSEEYVKNSGSSAADVFAAIGDETPAGTLAAGEQKKLLATEKSGDDTWYRIDGGYVKKAGGVETVTVYTAELIASGASVKYGETATVTASVKDGEGYKIQYSTDNGTSWSETAPTRTEPGAITVKVKATKEGAADLEKEVTLEVGAKPAEPTLVASGASVKYGETATVTASVKDGEGYKIQYSTDNGTSWSETAPTRTEPGTTTVKVRAIKEGAATLEKEVSLTVGDKPAAPTTTLTVHGGTFPYDGKAHACTYTLENGEGYTVRYSTDDGKTWKTWASDKDAPSLTKVGRLTVKVEAAKSGAQTLTVTVKLEVTAAAADGSIVTIVNCKTSVNVRSKATSSSAKLGQAKKGKTYKLLGVEGSWYKIQYTADKVGYVFHSYVKVGSGTAPAPDPDPVPGQKGYIVNCRTAVNVRKRATSSSTKLGTLKKGTEITITGASGKWTQISYNGGTAYVFSEYVSNKKPDEDVAGKTATIVNCQSFVNVREKASSSSKKLGTAKKGATYTVKAISGNWVQVNYDGKTGYVYKRYVKIG